jgi:hypothetical protein
MKRQVRQGVFESNSSSTHALCIATDTKYSLPNKVEFGFREFGWAVDKLSSRQERADYLYTSLAYVGDIDKLKEYIRFIHRTLKKNGVETFFEDFKLSVYGWDSDDVEFYIEPNDGYVDHGNETREFVEAVCSDEKLLLDYLFSDKSYILTGNDNDDIETEIHEDYPHREFYKWN